MMKQIKRIMLCITLLMAGLTIQCQQNDQDAIALKMIEGMRGALHLNGLSQQQIINGKLYPDTVNTEIINTLMLQINESKSLFARLLDEYIQNLGQVYEKKSGLFGGYRTSYYISSKADQSLSITPNYYAALMQTLQDAAQKSDWGTTIKIMFPVMSHENRSVTQKDLSLHEIISGLKNVPLPAGYSTAAIVGGVAATAAVAGGAYLLYNNVDMNDLRILGGQVGNYFEPQMNHRDFMLNGVPRSLPAAPVATEDAPVATEDAPIAVEDAPIAVEDAPVITQEPEAEPSFLDNMKNGVRRGLWGNEDATVANWQAGGDAETYGAPGLTGNEAMGVVTGGALSTAAGVTGTRYQAAQNTKRIAEQAAQVELLRLYLKLHQL